MQSEAAGLPDYAMQFRIRSVGITHYAVIYRDAASSCRRRIIPEQCAAREPQMSDIKFFAIHRDE